MYFKKPLVTREVVSAAGDLYYKKYQYAYDEYIKQCHFKPDAVVYMNALITGLIIGYLGSNDISNFSKEFEYETMIPGAYDYQGEIYNVTRDVNDIIAGKIDLGGRMRKLEQYKSCLPIKATSDAIQAADIRNRKGEHISFSAGALEKIVAIAEYTILKIVRACTLYSAQISKVFITKVMVDESLYKEDYNFKRDLFTHVDYAAKLKTKANAKAPSPPVVPPKAPSPPVVPPKAPSPPVVPPKAPSPPVVPRVKVKVKVCGPGMELNPKTNRCNKMCADGLTRDPVTWRCNRPCPAHCVPK